MASMKRPMSFTRTVLFLVCIFAWIALYCSGIIIGTRYYRQQLDPTTGTEDVYFLFYCWAMVFLNYSMSNIALLCCLAAVIGGMTQSNPDNLVALVAKGLFVYLITAAGSLVTAGTQLIDMTQSQYISIATTSSLGAFIVGYFPDVFNKMLFKARDNVTDSIDNPPKPTPAPVKPPEAEVVPPVEEEPKH